MTAEIVNIGDEILIGQILNTNAQYIAKELDAIGFKLSSMTTISDDADDIVSSLDKALAQNDLVLITGGLGPTKDDLTKHTLAQYFDSELVFDQKLFDHMEQLFQGLGRAEVPKTSYNQAEIPSKAIALHNKYGTAAGMWFDQNEKVCISLPGVPYEMKHLMQDEVIPRLKERFQTMFNYHRTILTTGLGESSLMEIIEDWENSLGELDIKLAYLPSPGRVRLRLTGRKTDKESLEASIDEKADELYQLIPNLIYGEEEVDLPEAIYELMVESGQSLSLAESCTGGNIAHELTLIPGSSKYFSGGVVSYSNLLKQTLLGVKEKTLEDFGAVSKETVEEMVLGAKTKLKTDYALSVSGIAGPEGGFELKPVGTVWIGLAGPDGLLESKKFSFGKLREQNIKKATNSALNMLRLELLRNK